MPKEPQFPWTNARWRKSWQFIDRECGLAHCKSLLAGCVAREARPAARASGQSPSRPSAKIQQPMEVAMGLERAPESPMIERRRLATRE